VRLSASASNLDERAERQQNTECGGWIAATQAIGRKLNQWGRDPTFRSEGGSYYRSLVAAQ